MHVKAANRMLMKLTSKVFQVFLQVPVYALQGKIHVCKQKSLDKHLKILKSNYI